VFSFYSFKKEAGMNSTSLFSNWWFMLLCVMVWAHYKIWPFI